jgi:hypothetical protein
VQYGSDNLVLKLLRSNIRFEFRKNRRQRTGESMLRVILPSSDIGTRS